MPPIVNRDPSSLPPELRERLVKVCGLLSSDHAGERAAAGTSQPIVAAGGHDTADAIVRPAALTRDQAIPPTDWRGRVAMCAARPHLLNQRERDFITNARGFSHYRRSKVHGSTEFAASTCEMSAPIEVTVERWDRDARQGSHRRGYVTIMLPQAGLRINRVAIF